MGSHLQSSTLSLWHQIHWCSAVSLSCTDSRQGRCTASLSLPVITSIPVTGPVPIKELANACSRNVSKLAFAKLQNSFCYQYCICSSSPYFTFTYFHQFRFPLKDPESGETLEPPHLWCYWRYLMPGHGVGSQFTRLHTLKSLHRLRHLRWLRQPDRRT